MAVAAVAAAFALGLPAPAAASEFRPFRSAPFSINYDHPEYGQDYGYRLRYVADGRQGATIIGAIGTKRVYDDPVVCLDPLKDRPNVVTGSRTLHDQYTAYLFGTYIRPGGTAKPSLKNYRNVAAAAYLIKEKHSEKAAWRDLGDVINVSLKTDEREYAAFTAQVAALRDEARAHATLTFKPTLTANRTGYPTTGAIDHVGVRNAGGEWLAGHPMTVTLSGPAVFTATGTKTWTGTSGTKPTTLQWRATANGSVGFSAEVGKVWTTIRIHDRQGAKYQRVLVGATSTLTRASSTTVRAIATFTPTVSTRTSAAIAKPGAHLTDTVIVRGAEPRATVMGTSTLYGPFATQPKPSAAAPSGTPVIGTARFSGTTDAEGNATVTTSPLTVPSAGYYVWVETLHESTSGTWSAVTGSFGVASEISLALAPTITTTVSARTTGVGDTISDTVTVAGIHSTVGGTPIRHEVGGALYGPLAPNNGSCAGLDWRDAPKRVIEAFPVTENGSTANIGETTVDAAGCWSYAETLTSWFGSDTEPFSVVEHPAGHVTQTTLVSRFAPTVASTTSTQILRPGDDVHDIIDIEGCRPGTAVAGTSTLHGPISTAPEPAPTVPESAVAVGATEWATTCGADGTATATTTTLHVPDDVTPGFYVWVETLTESATHTGVTGRFGVATETALAFAPTVATEVSARTATVGDTISDTVTVTGIHAAVGDTPIRHEVSGALHGPIAPVNGSCEGLDWSAAPKHRIEPFTVTTNGRHTGLGETVVDTEGCWSYAETLTSWLGESDESFSVVEHPVGHVTQTTLVTTPETPVALERVSAALIDAGVPNGAQGGVVSAGVLLVLLGGGALTQSRLRQHHGAR